MANNRLTIGLTGGIASGKSQASLYFTNLGIDVLDSDRIARDLFKSESIHLVSLREKFGDEIFSSNGELDRKALGRIVFSDKQSLKWLNHFTHPLINREMKEQLADSCSDYVILDIPLLINADGVIPEHLKSLIDRVLVINVEQQTQINRLLDRDLISEQEALNIINSQSSNEQKLSLADDVIDNNGDLENLRLQVEKLHQQYLKLC